MKPVIALLCALLAGACTLVTDAHDATSQWAGTWTGTLTNLPTGPTTTPIEVKLEIGGFPTEDHTSCRWRTTYLEAGETRQIKDYLLCRGDGPDDLFIDEQNGIRLASRMLGDVLVTPFQYGDLLLITRVQLRGDHLVQEILTVTDEPATDGVLPLHTRGMQRLVLTRDAAAERARL